MSDTAMLATALRAIYADASSAELAAPRYFQARWFIVSAEDLAAGRGMPSTLRRRVTIAAAIMAALMALTSQSLNPVRWATNTATSFGACASRLGHGDVGGCLRELIKNHDPAAVSSAPGRLVPISASQSAAAAAAGSQPGGPGSAPGDGSNGGGPQAVAPGSGGPPNNPSGPGPNGPIALPPITPPPTAPPGTPPPAPTPPPWSTTPFSFWEPFNKDPGGAVPQWWTQNPGPNGWAIDYGGMVSSGAGAVHDISLNGSDSWANYNVWTWVVPQVPPSDPSAGSAVTFRRTSAGQDECWIRNGQVQLVYAPNGGSAVVLNSAPLSYLGNGTQNFQLRAIAQNSYVGCKVDNNAAIGGSANSLTGGIGLHAFGVSYWTAVQAKSS